MLELREESMWTDPGLGGESQLAAVARATWNIDCPATTVRGTHHVVWWGNNTFLELLKKTNTENQKLICVSDPEKEERSPLEDKNLFVFYVTDKRKYKRKKETDKCWV